MRSVIGIIIGLIFLAPPLVFAENAATVGFPKQSVWLSKSEATAGDTIQIYAALYNAGTKKFSGTLLFVVDNERIAEREFSLEPGASVLESALWKTSEGAHTARAVIENASGIPVASITDASAIVAFAVAKPPTLPVAGEVSDVVSTVSQVISSVSPQVQSAIQTVHQAIEPYRESAVLYLEEIQKQRTEKPIAEQIFGVENLSETALANSATHISTGTNKYLETAQNAWSALSQVALAGALYATKTPALFYALLLAVIIGALYALFRWALRRPL